MTKHPGTHYLMPSSHTKNVYRQNLTNKTSLDKTPIENIHGQNSH